MMCREGYDRFKEGALCLADLRLFAKFLQNPMVKGLVNPHPGFDQAVQFLAQRRNQAPLPSLDEDSNRPGDR